MTQKKGKVIAFGFWPILEIFKKIQLAIWDCSVECTDVKKRNLVEKFGLVRFLGGFEGPRYTKKFRSKEFFACKYLENYCEFGNSERFFEKKLAQRKVMFTRSFQWCNQI